jgi:signal transduction histidine kinase
MTALALATVIFLILPVLVALYLVVYVWQRRQMTGATSFIGMMIAIAGWSITAALVVLTQDSMLAQWWLNCVLAFSPFLPAFTFVTIAEITEQPWIKNRRWLFLILPSITAILSLTSPFQFVYTLNLELVRSGNNYIGWISDFGIWWIVNVGYSYTMLLFSGIMMVRHILNLKSRLFQLRVLLLLFGVALPFLANIYSTLLSEVHYFTTPIMFNFSIPAVFWAIFRYRLFELVPIAREQVVNSLSDAFITLDQQQRVVDVNPSAAALSPNPMKSIIGQPITEAFPAFATTFQQALSGSNPHTAIQVEDAHYDLRLTEVLRDHNRVGQTMVLRDITAQRRAEAQARQTEIEQERLKTLNTFVTAASHEFRTPLTIIKTSAYLVGRANDAEKRAEKVSVIEEQVSRLNRIIEDMLMLAQINSPAQVVFEPLLLNTAIEDAVEQITAQLQAAGLHITTELAADLATIHGHQQYVHEALLALLHNALRYTPSGGTITVRTAQQDSQVVVSVQDTGIGIHPEHMPHIFDPFYRVDQARSTAGMGTGLSVVRQVMHLHGGEITVESVPQQGTTFQMRFPLRSIS